MSRKSSKALIAAAVVGTTTVVGAFYSTGDETRPTITAEPVSRGDVINAISATGTVQANTTVEVGTQVSGTIASLHADFNSIVKKGQVLARLDPALYQGAIEQATANLLAAEANHERMKVSLADAETKLARARELAEKQLISRVDLETAEVTVGSAVAQVKSAAAQVAQARASLQQAQVNLSKTIIRSPIDGIVIARNVDGGQTVAASLSAPTLYVLAADLTLMELSANIDEADVGRVVAGQTVEFTVDAYPSQVFRGTVKQVRLNPTIESNVVTYAAIITAANPELKLKPGMTASLTIEVARREDVLRVPSAALRYAPAPDVLNAVGADDASSVKGPRVWQHLDGRMSPMAVTPGESDGRYTEIQSDTLAEGAQVVTRIALGERATSASRTSSPLVQTAPGRPR